MTQKRLGSWTQLNQYKNAYLLCLIVVAASRTLIVRFYCNADYF